MRAPWSWRLIVTGEVLSEKTLLPWTEDTIVSLGPGIYDMSVNVQELDSN